MNIYIVFFTFVDSSYLFLSYRERRKVQHKTWINFFLHRICMCVCVSNTSCVSVCFFLFLFLFFFFFCILSIFPRSFCNRQVKSARTRREREKKKKCIAADFLLVHQTKKREKTSIDHCRKATSKA